MASTLNPPSDVDALENNAHALLNEKRGMREDIQTRLSELNEEIWRLESATHGFSVHRETAPTTKTGAVNGKFKQ